ncbi:zinc-binding dehydrogenase [Sphingobium sp. WCS2017Hpa-17]|uniref:zinc-dependent alcohol dehydrogenase n=1 Tax=Sphingobium sp. WCS2017Hpa-17 TaxID=3073638 RepID=UPI00288BB21D|nr:zinc-binding dehydrogenase [Sphingobium sp. WCS2017Hpa-17]
MLAADFMKPGAIDARHDASSPEPAAGEVLVAVAACGICGSDLHMFRDNSYRERLVRSTPEGYEIPGHEFAGTIAGVGQGVTDWAVGDRVVGVTGNGGGMAQFVTVPVNPFQLVRIPDAVSFEEAATTEPLADGLQMARKAAIAPGENVLVFGVGIIGLGVIQAIKARGLQPGRIIAVDIHDRRLEAAKAVGATHVVNPREQDLFEAVATLCGREDDFRGISAKVDVVIDCAGYIRHIPGPAPLQLALNMVANRNGRIVCFGGFEGEMSIDFSNVIRKEPTIMGSNGYAAEELVEALDLMAAGKVDRRSLLSHHFPLDQVGEAFAAQGRPDAVKVMLQVAQ